MNIAPQKTRIVFILHGKIRRIENLIGQISSVFSPDHFHIQLQRTAYKGHAHSLAKDAVEQGLNHIISVGGDGTLNEVLNGVIAASKMSALQTLDNLRIGILPYGAGNDFARGMGLSKSISDLKYAIEMDQWMVSDIGKMEFVDDCGIALSRYFINIADIGIGGIIAQKLSRTTKWAGATLTYQMAILTTLFTYNHQKVKIRSDSFNYDGNIMGVIMANGQYFGSGLGIAPDAKINDGLLNLILIGPISILDYLLQIPKLKKSILIEHPQLSYKTIKEVQINHCECPLPIDMDGEFVGFTPINLAVIPAQIKVLTPVK